jgi:hypothetical protein
MTRNVLRIGNALAVALALGSGVMAAFSKPADARAQTGTVTCWAESCSGNVCVRVQIECPPILKPIKPG